MSRNISRTELDGASDSGLASELGSIIYGTCTKLHLSFQKNEDKNAYVSSYCKHQNIIYAKIAKSLPGIWNMLNEQLPLLIRTYRFMSVEVDQDYKQWHAEAGRRGKTVVTVLVNSDVLAASAWLCPVCCTQSISASNHHIAVS